MTRPSTSTQFTDLAALNLKALEGKSTPIEQANAIIATAQAYATIALAMAQNTANRIAALSTDALELTHDEAETLLSRISQELNLS